MVNGTWQISGRGGPDWSASVLATGGGVFHTAAGLTLGSPDGLPLFARYLGADGSVLGIAVGARTRCRFPGPARHVTFPSLPALVPGVEPAAALDGLRGELRRRGVAEANFDSFDAGYSPGPATRAEYLLTLPADGDIVPSLSTLHRRKFRRAEREQLSVTLLSGEAARDAIIEVQRATVDRATARGRGFEPVQAAPWTPLLTGSLPLPPEGMAVFAALRDGQLLSAVLVGWAGQRAFYAVGGSTPDGYECGAAPWLQVRVAQLLAGAGISVYNLGGTPSDAADPASPANGLYRYKTGFGAQVVERTGLRWSLRPGHLRLHAVLGALRGR